ncbi:hypothetical protein CLAFUW4_10918 [Fulvia fulva]|uniref:SnoaL-like domain-containing protein n=1 Tax=Passalora fulva TaxID=5499 RepID=A0A9Q8PCS7_PASFU|nr:uncharacterized protein CLAFUR5_09960 [Fulvia fulva]KAK4620082.1 hypothetical protein CLAFUR4_10923 [Fulvia fulva]KAK4620924.1 hypothetical protein CLAFUR0_10930 [Fulvia fulva]UJO20047.1 hypothetical protein CLAFUR5_09960 [Fulvia fulva]WPV17303.1 hypothetical protein CLAFUW4_10918 [Fulvia fulva]WPV32476.1 hypothetical protein CLAFUW7_10916 [Fulvia fulva]
MPPSGKALIMSASSSGPSPASTATPATDVTDDDSITTSKSISSELEAFCWRFLDRMNTRDFVCADLRGYFATNFTAAAPGQRSNNSVEGLLRSRYEVVSKFPEFHLDYIGATTDLHEETGHAEVQMITEITGMPPGVRRQALNVFRWRKSKSQGGIWLCWDFTFMLHQPAGA